MIYCLCALKEKNKQTNKQTNTHFEILGYFSQQIFFQKQKVAGMNLFVYAEAMWAFASRGCLNLKGRTARGRDRIRYNELRGKTGHRVGFIRITLT